MVSLVLALFLVAFSLAAIVLLYVKRSHRRKASTLLSKAVPLLPVSLFILDSFGYLRLFA